MATAPDGSILTGDYWNYRIVHYEDDQTATSAPTAASHTSSRRPHWASGPTPRKPLRHLRRQQWRSLEGYVYETEGSLYDVNQYSPSGSW